MPSSHYVLFFQNKQKLLAQSCGLGFRESVNSWQLLLAEARLLFVIKLQQVLRFFLDLLRAVLHRYQPLPPPAHLPDVGRAEVPWQEED